jgi:large subunit ribosomal protein L15
MQQHQLKRKTKRATSVQVVRGGNRGKSSGKGHKGQKARGGKIRPELRDMIKSIPKLSGRGVNYNKPTNLPAKTVALGDISDNFKKGDKITPNVLFEKGLVRKVGGKLPKVKIVSSGEIKIPLIFRNCLFSETARKAVTEAGGEIK